MTIGTRIKNLRTSLKMTQDELAEAAGTKKQTIHKYETGIIANIPASKIKAIADKLETTPAHLMGWTSTETQRSNNAIADIIIKLRTDDELLNMVKDICALPAEQRTAIQTLLSALNSGNK